MSLKGVNQCYLLFGSHQPALFKLPFFESGIPGRKTTLLMILQKNSTNQRMKTRKLSIDLSLYLSFIGVNMQWITSS